MNESTIPKVKITIDGHPLWDVPKPAADEIERLTAELNDAEAVHKDLWCKLDTLTATVEALEKAMEINYRRLQRCCDLYQR